MFCSNCGAQLNDNQVVCLQCGCATQSFAAQANPQPVAQPLYTTNKDPFDSDKDWLVTLLLCLFLGGLGIHRFYAGKTGTGILWFFTLGLFGFGSLIDLIMIATGKFTDGRGRYIMNN